MTSNDPALRALEAAPTTMPLPSLDIVLVNWNSGNQLRNCLLSLASAGPEQVRLERVVVVDNASGDGSQEGLGGAALPLQVVQNDSNRGFARACNQGARESRADYLLFLNPDTLLLDGSLAVPVAFLEREENAGVGVCGIQLFEEDGRVARSCARFPSWKTFLQVALGLPKLFPGRVRDLTMSDWDHGCTREVDHVIGAFYLIRRSLFAELGGFDERFFVYLEDLDLSLRVRRAGWRIVYLSEARAFHKGGGTSEQVKAKRLSYVLDSRLRYVFKHAPPAGAWLVTAATLVGEPWVRLFYAAVRGDFAGVGQTLKAYLLLCRQLPAIFAGKTS